MKKIVLAAAAATTLALPASAGAHATVNAMQPQGKSLTSARQAYVVRVPNEQDQAATYQVTMFVPPAIQHSIAVAKKPGWKVSLVRDDGAVKKITWRALRPSGAIDPHFYDEFPVRWQNPATAQRTCFWIYQTYGSWAKSRWSKLETVKWSGASTSDTPASCVNFTEA